MDNRFNQGEKMVRISKIIFLAAIAFFCFLAAFGNITDYMANFPFVQKALMMIELLPNTNVGYRAIQNPLLHHVAYIVIIIFESGTSILCAIGAYKLFQVRDDLPEVFNQCKSIGVAGLILGFLTWYFLFFSIGGEWFSMWMSPSLSNALNSAFQFYITCLIGLIFLVLKD